MTPKEYYNKIFEQESPKVLNWHSVYAFDFAEKYAEYRIEEYKIKESKKVWSVYIVECADGTFYTGISNDVLNRITKHNDKKGAKYTSSRLSVVLVYKKEIGNRSAASKEEHRIKKLTKRQKINLINSMNIC